MKKFFAAIVLAVFALVGCDTGSSAGPNDDPTVESSSSSSSVEQGSSSIEKKKKKKSSSSKNEESSSSVKLGSSSSVETPNSSSSELSEFSSSSAGKAKSSSSVVTLATPCKTETEDNCEYGTVLDDRDGQTYKTVKIGDQWWMAENLNYKVVDAYCYSSSADKCNMYGRLYTWAAAMDSSGTWSTNGKGCGYNKTCSPTYPVRGVCPEGWHLPSITEFETLFTAVGGVQDEDYAYRWNGAGTVLKSTSGWYDDGNGTDAFGVSALPAGLRDSYGDYYDEGSIAHFWSSTEDGSGCAYDMYLNYNYDYAYLNYNDKYRGLSVRCLKD